MLASGSRRRLSNQPASATVATSLQAIADAVKARGIPTPGGRGGWCPATVAPWRVWVDLVHEGSADAAAALQRTLLEGSIR